MPGVSAGCSMTEEEIARMRTGELMDEAIHTAMGLPLDGYIPHYSTLNEEAGAVLRYLINNDYKPVFDVTLSYATVTLEGGVSVRGTKFAEVLCRALLLAKRKRSENDE